MPTKWDGMRNHFPSKPIIDGAVLCTNWETDKDGNYAGPIRPGMIFAWEPFLPHARELTIVDEVSAEKVSTVSFPVGDKWELHVNDISRFREAVIPTKYKPQTPPSKRKFEQYAETPEELRKHLRPDTISRTIAVTPPVANKPFIYMQEEVPMNFHNLNEYVEDIWHDDQYPKEFNTEVSPHRHLTHALLHAVKACGKLTEVVDDADHRLEQGGQTVKAIKALADLVICAQRMAQTIDIRLDNAVSSRLRELGKRYPPKPVAPASEPSDAYFETSAKVLFEEIHGIHDPNAWERQPNITKKTWYEYARKHFLRTAAANVTKAEIMEDPDEGAGMTIYTTGGSYTDRLVPRQPHVEDIDKEFRGLVKGEDKE
jgi:hypothetical protein